MVHLVQFFVAAIFLVQAVYAHFQLTYPASRGFDETQEPTAPCGGFNTLQNRTAFPINNAFVEIMSEHVSYEYTVNILLSSNPTSDFGAAVSVAQGSRNYPEAACLPISISNVPNVANGTNATIQVVYNAGDGVLYQCTDVTLSTNPAGFNYSACTNATSGSNTSSQSNTGSFVPYTTGFTVTIAVAAAVVISLLL